MSLYFNLTVMATKTAKQYIYGVKEKQRLVAANKRNLFIADAIQQDIYKAQEIERVLELEQKSAFTTIEIPLPLPIVICLLILALSTAVSFASVSNCWCTCA